MSEAPTIFLSAADISGDAHAAGLIEALRRRLGDVRFVGVGGPRMTAAGCELLAEPARRAAMLAKTVPQVFYYLGVLRRAARGMSECRPAVFVPVDSPALNWHLARAARRRGVPVTYYIAPQVWAWAPWRVRKLRRLTDAVACILPFEEQYLRARGVNARFVGHPLFDDLPPAELPDLGEAAAAGRWRIALLPGSRRSEINAHAPALAAVMDRLRRRHGRAEFTFTALDDASAEIIRRRTGRNDLPIEIGKTSEVLSRCHFAVAASGTVTLQVAHFGVPMVIFYHASRWAYRLLRRWLIQTPHLSLVNILAGEQLVPELMPWHGDIDGLAAAAEGMLDDLETLKRLRKRLVELVAPLRVPVPGTAAGNAAEMVLQTMR
jgi:lipid-A-disaccharide synthase